MWKKFVNDYLRFSRKDRTGILVLVALIFMVLLLPAIWPAKKMDVPSPEKIEKIKARSAHLRTKDSVDERSSTSSPAYISSKTNAVAHAETFYFDPNTLDEAGWQRLGIRAKTAATIRRYVEKGGKFKKPEDIGKIYGLFKDDYERLLPFVRIQQGKVPVQNSVDTENSTAFQSTPGKEYPQKTRPAPAIVEINSADTTAFIALPGIGVKLAARIVNFRSKLGGFYSVVQLAETYGLPDSTFTRIQPMLQCNAALLQRVNINTADANTLKQHPYIRWNLANAIVQYRSQHGNFKSADELLQVAQVTPEILGKLKPYLVLQ